MVDGRWLMVDGRADGHDHPQRWRSVRDL